MITLIALVLGAAFGAFRAKSRGGNTQDLLHYAAVHAMIFGLIAVIGSMVLLGRL